MDLGNPDAAENTGNGIMDVIDKLEYFAEIGVRLSLVVAVETDYRFLPSGNYIVF